MRISQSFQKHIEGFFYTDEIIQYTESKVTNQDGATEVTLTKLATFYGNVNYSPTRIAEIQKLYGLDYKVVAVISTNHLISDFSVIKVNGVKFRAITKPYDSHYLLIATEWQSS